MMSKKAKDLWDNVRQRLKAMDDEIIWVVFRTEFLEKYFTIDVQNKKEIEFLEIKKVNMIIVEYAAKFKELVKFCPYYNNATIEGSKCIKFESRLRPNINQGIGYQDIRWFPTMVNNGRIYDKDSRARFGHYKNLSDKRGKNHNHGNCIIL